MYFWQFDGQTLLHDLRIHCSDSMARARAREQATDFGFLTVTESFADAYSTIVKALEELQPTCPVRVTARGDPNPGWEDEPTMWNRFVIAGGSLRAMTFCAQRATIRLRERHGELVVKPADGDIGCDDNGCPHFLLLEVANANSPDANEFDPLDLS